MNNFNPIIDIESTNKYENAKKDLLKALASFDKLTSKQKENLLTEFFGATNVTMICNALNIITR